MLYCIVCVCVWPGPQKDAPAFEERRQRRAEARPPALAVQRQQQAVRRRPQLGPRLRQRLRLFRRPRTRLCPPAELHLPGAAPPAPARVRQRYVLGVSCAAWNAVVPSTLISFLFLSLFSHSQSTPSNRYTAKMNDTRIIDLCEVQFSRSSNIDPSLLALDNGSFPP